MKINRTIKTHHIKTYRQNNGGKGPLFHQYVKVNDTAAQYVKVIMLPLLQSLAVFLDFAAGASCFCHTNKTDWLWNPKTDGKTLWIGGCQDGCVKLKN